MGLRTALRRAEKAAEGQLETFIMTDGRMYAFDPQEAGAALFVHACASLRAPYVDGPPPEEPEILAAIRRARDPDAVIARLSPADPSKAFVNLPAMVYGED